MVNVVQPLRADVFAVTDDGAGRQGRTMLHTLSLFRDNFKAFGVIENHARASSLLLDITSAVEHVRVVTLAGANLTSKFVIQNEQWFKLHEAWKLMEFAEAEAGIEYDLVVKLRFDVTPLNVLNVCGGSSEAITSSFRAVHGNFFIFYT
jgi:hypothetical protein